MKHGAAEIWNHESRAAEPWKHVTIHAIELWNNESMVLCFNDSMFVWFHEFRTAEPQIHIYITAETWIQENIGPWIHK